MSHSRHGRSNRRTLQLETLEPRMVLDSTVVFNEIMYNATGNGTPEWVELHNQMAVNVDVSLWRLSDAVDFTIPNGTIVPGGGFLVIAANLAAMQTHTGFGGALGPFTGSLDNGGEQIELVNHMGRVMDRIEYGDDAPWPVGPDGSGATLAKLHPQLGSEDGANWITSPQMGGTPGASNVPVPVTTVETTLLPMNSSWRYNKSGSNLGTAWTAIGYNDQTAGWSGGPALLGFEQSITPAEPVRTEFNPFVPTIRTYYFRTTFPFDGNLNGADLRVRHWIDDGAVFYLNGTEVLRVNMPGGTIDSSTLASPGVTDASLSGFATLPSNLLTTGTNHLAVEVHQNSDTSSDVLFGAEVVLQRTIINPGVGAPTLALNEVSGAFDGTFRIEIRNNGTTSQSLENYVLAATGDLPLSYTLPATTIPVGGYVVLDHTQLGFRPPVDERLFLFEPNRARVVDAVVVKDRARGRTPDGSGLWHYTSADTVAAANAFTFRDEIVINEIQYHARSTIAKAATYSSSTVVPITGSWCYNQTGVDLGTTWRNPGYNGPTGGCDGWTVGGGLFYNENAALPAPKTTLLTLGRPTYYFRTTFDLAGDPASAVLQLRHVIDDGAVFYLNGTEFARFNMPATPITYTTGSSAGVGDAVFVGPLSVPSNLLVTGTNYLAVELHQQVPASPDVVFGAEISGLTLVSPELPYAESSEEWIEVYNRSNHVVDLTGWDFEGGLDYNFPAGTMMNPGEYLVIAQDPAALLVNFPGIRVLGPFAGGLNNVDDRIVLEDQFGNPADEVHYYEGGRWPDAADGGGRTLELRSPWSDNSKAEAWAASDESARSQWRHYTYTAQAIAPVYDPITSGGDFREIRVGLLDAGEVLFDNFSVIENPGGTPVQMVQNGSFTGDAIGGGANRWRLLGTHAATHVADDPDNPGNKVLRIVAEGKADYLDNLLETTTVGNAPIVPGRAYQISFDAKWLSGTPQLRTELYYNRVVKLDILDQPTLSGTPGSQNSTFVANFGPTYSDFRHGPAVPAVNQPATVSVVAADPDGVASMTLFYSVAGAAFASAPMVAGAGGSYSANIPGQNGGTIVQFYVRGTDALGAFTTYPAAAHNSRALIKWNDGQAQVGTARHNFRMIQTQADINKMFAATNMMSNERLGGTVVYDESEVFYDVGIRQRGSMFSRGSAGNTGYNIKFQPDHLFRGVHSSVTMKAPGRAEILVKHTALQVGVPEMYDDIVYMNTPSLNVSSIANMSMARYGDEYITTQYEDGGDGTVFKMQGVRVLLNNTGAENLKTYQPVGWIPAFDLANLGEDKEQYRWSIQIMNNRAKDDYGPLVDAMQSLSLTGLQLEQAVDDYIDVDQWMRVFALQSLWGIGDAYMQGNPHNIDFFIRPSDGKLLALPWDWNFVASYGATSPLYGIETKNVTRVIDRPIYKRLFYGHMRDMIQTKFNTAYMSQWTTHYGQVAGEGYGGHATYIQQRGAHVMSQLATLAPNVPFNITTPNGQQINDVVTTVVGDGWIDVREIRVDGNPAPLDVTWTDFESWQVALPIAAGTQTLRLRAYNHQGVEVGTDTITITSTVTGRPLQDHLRITELMYHPDEPTEDELALGFSEADSFEYVEFHNTGSLPLDLTGVRFADGIEFDFTGSSVTTLPPGGYVLVVEDLAAFEARYGGDLPVAGQFAGRLNNAGEHLRIEDALGVPILDFTYDDSTWYPPTDGEGYSLVVVNPGQVTSAWNTVAGWRASFELSGSTGERDVMLGDLNSDDRVGAADLALLQDNFGAPSGATKFTGDLTGDGAVSRDDLVILLQHFGRYYDPPAPSPAASPAAVSAAPLTSDRTQDSASNRQRVVAQRQPVTTRAATVRPSELDASRLPVERTRLQAVRRAAVAADDAELAARDRVFARRGA